MGVLLLGPEFEATALRVRQFAEDRANWYVPGATVIPGDDARYVFQAGTYRVVFSWTLEEATGLVYRHLSVSAATPGRAPNPYVVFQLAYMLGFTGVEPDEAGLVRTFGPTWQFGHDPDHNAAIVAERVE